jgi:hypothetical protein
MSNSSQNSDPGRIHHPPAKAIRDVVGSVRIIQVLLLEAYPRPVAVSP